MTVTGDNVAIETTETGRRFVNRSFDTLAQANAHWQANKPKNRQNVIGVDFQKQGPELQAVHIERAYHARVDHVNILGDYDVGVALHFCLYGQIRDVNVEGARIGFIVANGAYEYIEGEKLWPDGEHHNSASNQSRVVQSRYFGQHDDGIGFILEGGDNCLFDQTTVEGKKCKTAWQLAPRASWSDLTLSRSWLEVPVKTAIWFDGYKTQFEITRFNMGVAPEVFLDCRGDQGSTIYIDRNNWKFVPKMVINRSTNIELGKNSFSDDEFWESVTRVG